MVTKPTGTDYRKLESDMIFGPDEGVEHIKKSTPEATEIKLLNEIKTTWRQYGLSDITTR